MRASRGSRLAAGALAAAALAACVPAAQAHHDILVREVRPSTADPTRVFIELQALRQGQNDVAGFPVHSWDAAGLTRHDFLLPGNVADARSQGTILIGGPGLAGVADFVDPGLALSPAGGAVCFAEANPPDCVAWGSFPLNGDLPFPGAGPRAPAVPEGLSLTRTIERGCATALDSPDDRNNSLQDLALTSPTPHPNSAGPAGRDCVPCGGVDATIVGTDGKETLRGTRGRDVIAGMAGADRILGLGGDDILCGGIGKDVLVGGKGRDRMIGGRGRDICRGGKGKDTARSCEAGRG